MAYLKSQGKGKGMNGWQRLWVVICLVMAILIGWYAQVVMPTEERTTYYHQTTMDQLTRYLKEATESSYSNDYITGLKKDIQKENEDYAKALAALPSERTETMTTALGIWLGLSVGLYIAGWLIGWIYRGFRPRQQ
ncbi:hypothetical protein KC131_15150 [Pseudomonas sp. JQ170]|uniref:hypothetical protein n=1 Tax=unclassified Pseudomonas TaxID=196821 RepID=UPI0026557309|nr:MULTISPECIES: hypothetical protein [unclassified Pseudomonas]MDN7141983.1 hypothetical protein [Pseudomonas sp. JQ170]WRO78280.1 hypothetical protein U9R80_11610 [Pseudomonas sp. 170C]